MHFFFLRKRVDSMRSVMMIIIGVIVSAQDEKIDDTHLN